MSHKENTSQVHVGPVYASFGVGPSQLQYMPITHYKKKN